MLWSNGRSVIIGLLGVAMLSGGVAAAEPQGSVIDQLAARTGASALVLERELDTIAKEHGLSSEELAQAMVDGLPTDSVGEAVPLSGGGRRPLGEGRGPGDIYYSSGGVGHTGLYVAKWQVAEAPGIGDRKRVRQALSVNVNAGNRSAKMWITGGARETSLRRQRAVNWALSHLNRPYNSVGFAVNRKVEASHYNCSQFVWAAFKTQGLDLDLHREVVKGGLRLNLGVYPYEIRSSGSVFVYENL